MKGAVKGIAYTVLALTGLVVLAVVLLVTLVNPNDYRDDISRIAKDTTGIELKLGGDLSWRFYPVLGFGANGVELSLRSGQPTLVSIGDMAVGVKILPLLSRKIEIDALDIGSLHANLLVDEKGENNWQMASVEKTETDVAVTGSEKNQSGSAPSATQATGELPDLFIPRVRIHSSTIQYQDKSAAVAYNVDLPLLELENVNLKESFPVLLEARVRDQAGLDLTTKVQGNISTHLSEQQFAVNDLRLAAQVAGLFVKPVAINVQGDLQFDQGRDTATIKLARMQFSNLVSQLQLTASGVSTAPAFEGHLETEVFDARVLMASLDIPEIKTQDADAMTRVQLNMNFAGTPQKVSIKPLAIKLDDSTLSGDVSIVDIEKQAIRFGLQLDKLDADRYLPPATPVVAGATPKPATAQAVGEAAVELIPVETLRALNLKGTFKAGEVRIKQIPVRDIALSIKAMDGNVQITDLGAKLLQGTLAGTVGVDARENKPKITTRINLNDIEMSELMQPFVTTKLLSGRTSLNVDTSTEGNDIDTLLKQALGQINLNMANTVIHGVNVNQIATDAVKNKLGDFAALVPDYEKHLPKSLKGDTEIRNLLANMKVENGHLIMPDFNADTGEGQLSANGDIDLLNKGFDYRFGVVLSALADNKYLKGTQWPVRCKGNMDSPVADWCRPDSKAVNKALEQAATLAIRDKGAQELGKQLGLENADEAAVKEELRQKAKKEEEKAKKKLSESFNKKLNQFLEKQ